MTLSKDQQIAISKLKDWFKNINKSRFITLGGYAGTGKTTMMSIFRKQLKKEHKNLSVSFCSYTGKAVRVLSGKLRENEALFAQDTISTIHSLIYAAVKNSKDEIIGWERKSSINSDLIILDEASMVDEFIWKDLLSYGIPIIAVGDHGQLPPIRGKFNLMDKPMLKLEEIHRQAKDNPIILLSMEAREKGEVRTGHFGSGVVKMARTDEDSREMFQELLLSHNSDSLVLCGYNKTRVKMNQWIRNSKEFEGSEPEGGDRVICLKNNHQKLIYNGMMGQILKLQNVDEDFYQADIELDGEKDIYKGLILKHQFNSTEKLESNDFAAADLFDFGYAITVHKAQGSQAKRVILFEERFRQMDNDMWKRWLYTAVTRAEEELYILGN